MDLYVYENKLSFAETDHATNFRQIDFDERASTVPAQAVYWWEGSAPSSTNGTLLAKNDVFIRPTLPGVKHWVFSLAQNGKNADGTPADFITLAITKSPELRLDTTNTTTQLGWVRYMNSTSYDDAPGVVPKNNTGQTLYYWAGDSASPPAGTSAQTLAVGQKFSPPTNGASSTWTISTAMDSTGSRVTLTMTKPSGTQGVLRPITPTPPVPPPKPPRP